MTSFESYSLRFPDGFHIATGGFAEEQSDLIIHSDTLFSAVCSSARLLYGNPCVEQFLAPGAVVLSSAFPYSGSTRYFPRPLSSMLASTGMRNKDLKKIRFLSQSALERLLHGETLDISTECIVDSIFLSDAPDNIGRIVSTSERPRVTVDRISHQGTIFNVAETRFEENAGLHFLATFSNQDLKRTFTTALRLLGDEGIGSDRSIGKGWFEVSESRLELKLPSRTSDVLLLSLCAPSTDELASIIPAESSYEISRRGGWVSGSGTPGGGAFRKKSLRMLTEGSVLRLGDNASLRGMIARVLDGPRLGLPHHIYRNAQAFTLPLLLQS